MLADPDSINLQLQIYLSTRPRCGTRCADTRDDYKSERVIWQLKPARHTTQVAVDRSTVALRRAESSVTFRFSTAVPASVYRFLVLTPRANAKGPAAGAAYGPTVNRNRLFPAHPRCLSGVHTVTVHIVVRNVIAVLFLELPLDHRKIECLHAETGSPVNLRLATDDEGP